jgi:amino acid transporter
MTYRTASGRLVTAGRKLAEGGEGWVFAVTAPRAVVFKKYKPETLAKATDLERKVRAMVANPPVEWRDVSGHVTLAWPSDVVLEDGRFAGFLMPVVDTQNTVELHQIANPTDRDTTTGAKEWTRGFTWKYLVRTAANLAQATQVLHGAGSVIGDFNERNILVSSQARVALIDCDSMQVRAPGGERYLCRVGRMEFMPPELQRANWSTTVRQPSSDLFALAVHIYQLLMNGEHPFRGTWTGTGEKPDAPILARQGDWAHKRGGRLKPRRRAIDIGLLPDEVKVLFRRAFEDGATRPSARPTAQEWHVALSRLDRGLQQCRANRAHYYRGDQKNCPWCQYQRQSPGQTAGRTVTQLPLPAATAFAPVTPAPTVPAPAAPLLPGVTGTIRLPSAVGPRTQAAAVPGALTDAGLKARATRTGLFMASTGSVLGGGWLFGAVAAASLAGPAALLAWIIGGAAVLVLALVYAELCAMFPVSGGLARFPVRAFGGVVGTTFGWLALLQAAAVTPVEVLATESYAARWLPRQWGTLVSPASSLPTGKGYLYAIGLIALFTWINWCGFRAFARLNNFLTFWKLAVAVLIGAELLTHFHGGNFRTSDTWMPYGARGVLSAVSSGGIVFAYLGFEQAGQFAGEARNPQRDVPWAIIASVAAAVVLYVLLQTSFIGALPAGDLAHGFADLSGKPALYDGFISLAGTAGVTGGVISALRATPTIGVIGAGLTYSATTPRLSYGMSRSGTAPAVFAKTNRNGVPYAGLFAAAAASLLFMLPGTGWNQFVGDITSCSALMYAAGPLCLGAFRLQFPAQHRPYRMPSAGTLAPAAFTAANLLIYWSGWDVNWRVGLALLIGTAVLLGWQRPANPNPKAIAWLGTYLAGMGLLSRLGQYYGGTGTLPMWWDIVLVALFSVVVYHWAVRTRL